MQALEEQVVYPNLEKEVIGGGLFGQFEGPTTIPSSNYALANTVPCDKS
jgi:hypothetical protein